MTKTNVLKADRLFNGTAQSHNKNFLPLPNEIQPKTQIYVSDQFSHYDMLREQSATKFRNK